MQALTVAEVARVLRTHPHQVYKWVRQGRIRAFRIGTAVRISEAELKRLMEPDTAPQNARGGR